LIGFVVSDVIDILCSSVLAWFYLTTPIVGWHMHRITMNHSR